MKRGGCGCVVPGCHNLGRHLIPGTRGTDSITRSLWMKAMKLEGHNLKMKYPVVCSLHFKETDYMDCDIEPLGMRRRNLKRHAVPSIFPWNQPSTKKSTFISVEEPNSLSESESEKENIDPRDPLVESTDEEINIGKRSSENSSFSSDKEYSEEDTFRPFTASGITKTYANINTPIKFIPELPYHVTGTAPDDPIQDPLCLQESDELQETIDEYTCLAGCDIDVGSNLDIYDFVVKQEENMSDKIAGFDNTEKCENVEKEEENVLHNIQNSSTAKSCETCGEIPFFSVHSYKNEKNGVHFYTGLETFDKLMFVFHSLGNAVNNLKYFYGGPPEHLDPLEQFCMTLLILRRHREFEDIAMTYKTSVKQVTNIFITWIPFMALQWRTIDVWIDRDTVTHNMPLDFNDKYPNTRVIIDATECPIKKPHLPTTQQITFSTYKNRNLPLNYLLAWHQVV